jgi:hypothetical protein
MWEQYGEQHMGVCLLFETAKLRDSVLRSLESQRLPEPFDKPVRHTLTGPRVPEIDFANLSEAAAPSVVIKKPTTTTARSLIAYRETPLDCAGWRLDTLVLL